VILNTWIFQANPNSYLVDAALDSGLPELTWLVNKHRNHIKIDDDVLIWRCGKNAALVAEAKVLTDVKPMLVPAEEKKFEVTPAKFAGPQPRVKLRVKKVVPPIPRDLLLKQPELASVAVFKGCTGTNFALSADQAAAILRLIEVGS
jgi:hypothetical protein